MSYYKMVQEKKLEKINQRTLIIGVDIAKKVQWARFIDQQGREIHKPLRFDNTINGYLSLQVVIERLKKERGMTEVLVGMESTGHYQKTLMHYMKKQGYTVVLVNPYHTKQAKELDDNSQTKHDQKDAMVIAKLVRDGRYYDYYEPTGCWGELRVLTATRLDVRRLMNACKNRIGAMLDEYFPEYETVFKKIFEGIVSMHLLRVCPLPADVIELGVDGVLREIKRVVKRAVGIKKAKELVEAAQVSIGVTEGCRAAKLRLGALLDEYTVYAGQLEKLEAAMEAELAKTGLKHLLEIPGIGVVSLASFLGETGDLSRFNNGQQIVRLAGYSLTENSSGKSKSESAISKRGRKNLRSVLYQMALVMVAKNAEMKKIYQELKTREKNPLKKKQALIAVSCRIARMLFSMAKHKESYRPDRVRSTSKAA